MNDKKVISLSGARDKEKKEEQNVSNNTKKEPVYCSFCQRSNHQVVKMIKGPGVNICSECTMIAVQYLILEDRLPTEEAQKVLNALWGKSK